MFREALGSGAAPVDLDANATTCPLPEVVETLRRAMAEIYGNASSVHALGREARRLVAAASDDVAVLLEALPEQLVFTSGGTESNVTALENLARKHRRLVTTSVEHPSVRAPLAALASRGSEIVTIAVDAEGVLDLAAFETALSPGSAAAVQWVNGETGAVQPIPRIVELCASRAVPLLVDAAQAVGRLSIDLATLPIDYLTFSGHKIHGPKGVGVLYARAPETLVPLIDGGGQQGGRRPGTVDAPAIAALGAACRLRYADAAAYVVKLQALRDRLEQGILATCGPTRVNAAESLRVANTSNIEFIGLDGQALLARLDAAGVCCSQTSACASARPEPSPTLTAMGRSETEAYASLRFSVSILNTEAQIDRAVSAIAGAVSRLRALPMARVP